MLPGAPTFDPSRPSEAVSARPGAVGTADRNAAAPERGPEPARARLAYDRELSRTFVEVVDLDSGEVVERFPPEEIVRHVDALLEQAEAERAAKRAGLVLDRVV